MYEPELYITVIAHTQIKEMMDRVRNILPCNRPLQVKTLGHIFLSMDSQGRISI
jgi:hypothetical protein